MVKDTLSHPNCIFKLTSFISVFVKGIQKDEFSQTTGADDIKKDEAQRGTFLSSELGHSPKWNVKLLGREQRSDFHHNRTTLSRHAGLSLVLSVSVSHPDVSIYRNQVPNLSDKCAKSFGNYVCISSQSE